MVKQPDAQASKAGEATSRPLLRGAAVAALVLILVVVVAVVVNNARGNSAADDGAGGDPTSSPSEGMTSETAEPIDDGDESTEPPAPLDVSGPQEGPIDTIETEQARVEEGVALVVQATNEMAERGDGATEGLETIATGFVLGELENLSREQAEQGYTQSGEATIVSTELLSAELDADPPTLLLGVCIDVSGITLTDANGNDVSELLYNPGHPVRHEYGADFIDEVWKISTHEIPSDQDCPSPEES